MKMLTRYTLSQSVANTDAELIIPTLLTVDGRMGWNITKLKCFLTNTLGLTATTDCSLELQLNTETGTQNFVDKDNIAQLKFLYNGTAASTSGYWVESSQEWASEVGRLTVAPNLYARLITAGFTAFTYVNFEIEYETVKLTDMEVMRLLQGGA